MKFLKGTGIFLLVCLALSLWYVIVGIILIVAIVAIVQVIRKRRYFASPEFQMHRQRSAMLVSEYNEISSYAHELYTRGYYELGTSTAGMYSHLATVERAQPKKGQPAGPELVYHPHVYNASPEIVVGAEGDPIGSLIRYFNLDPTPRTLDDVQRLGFDIARLEGAIENTQRREHEMLTFINPPQFVVKYFAKEFWKQLNAYRVQFEIPYPVYRFENKSLSVQGNRAVTVTLNTPTIDALSETLDRKIRWAYPEIPQRTLMTAQLRQRVKERDNYTCQNPGCRASIARNRNLLMEVAYVLPPAQGGSYEPDNLRTLCWRCSRSGESTVLI